MDKNGKQDLIDQFPTGLGIFEIRNKMLYLEYMNEAYYKMLGFQSENRKQYLGEYAMNVVYPQDRSVLSSAVKKYMAGANRASADYRVKNSNGDWVWLSIVGSVIERKDNYIKLYVAFTDCDTMMRTQQELQSSKAMLDAALQNAKVTALRYDLKERCITDTGSFGRKYHLPVEIPNMPQGLLETGIICEDSISDMKKIFSMVGKGSATQKDICAKDSDGVSFVWYSVTFTSIYDENGGCTEAIGTFVDITERKEKELRYLRQFDSMSDIDDANLIAKGTHNLSTNAVMFYSSKKDGALSLDGSGNYDMALTELIKVVVQQDKKEEIYQKFNREKLLKNFVDGNIYGNIDYQRTMPDGKKIWANTRYALFEEPTTGDVIAFIYSYDITDRVIDHQITSRLSSMEYEALGLLDVKTHQYKLRDILAHLEGPKIIGRGDFDERAKTRLPIILVPTEKEEIVNQFQINNIVKQLEKVKVYNITYSIIDDEHEIRRKKCQFCYLDQTKTTILYCRSDITAIYQKEQDQLQKTEEALQEAKEANAAKSAFLSRMSHDIRTPMNTIVNLTKLVKEELDDKNAALEDLEKIETSNEFLLSLVNDILDMTRIEQKNLELNPERYSYHEFLNYIHSTFDPLCKEKHIRFIIEKGFEDVDILMDKVRFNQMCFNLLSNAVKYTPEGGNIEFKMVHGRKKDGKLPCDIYVKDNGIGMSKEFQERMFEPFAQEGRAYKAIEGTGLGLSIVKEIVELLDGTIDVQSVMYEGTTFHVHVDMIIIDEKVPEDKPEDNRWWLLSGKHVLVVEDHFLNQEIARRLLANVGVTVHMVNNGMEGLDEFRRNYDKYDAILMDMRMPVMDGLQATREIRKLSFVKARQIPIIAMTANAFSQDRKESAEAGMNAHLAKPIEPKLLYQTLVELILDN